jgi:4-hydroxy-tetrahydrodipicolinate synthase
LIKLVQEMTGHGSARVRAPRLPLAGAELAAAQQVIRFALDHRPNVAAQPVGGAA